MLFEFGVINHLPTELFCETWIPSNLLYKLHIGRQYNSNYFFILDLTHGFNGLGKDNYKMRRETFKCWDFVRLLLEIWLLEVGLVKVLAKFYNSHSVLTAVTRTKQRRHLSNTHYDDVIMGTIASQITSLTSVYSTVYSGADQSKHQSSASLAFVWGIHRDRWIPHTNGQLHGKCFHLMTSSCERKCVKCHYSACCSTNMRHWNGSSLVQAMCCCHPAPCHNLWINGFYQEQILAKFNQKMQNFSFKKMQSSDNFRLCWLWFNVEKALFLLLSGVRCSRFWKNVANDLKTLVIHELIHVFWPNDAILRHRPNYLGSVSLKVWGYPNHKYRECFFFVK